MRVMIDTCVIMDAVQGRKPFDQDAEQVFLAASNMLFDGFITAKAMTDIFYLSHRLTHDNAKARTILGRLAAIFEVADTAGADVMEAIASNTADFEDAVMIETAVREKMDCIVTRNTHDYQYSPIRVLLPGDFIRELTGQPSV